jgi:hypothetical protein
MTENRVLFTLIQHHFHGAIGAAIIDANHLKIRRPEASKTPVT